MRQYPLAVVFGLLLLPLAWPIDAMARTPSQSMVRDGINHTPKDKQKASDASRRKAVEAARRKAQQEAARRKAQEEARRKAQQDAARRKALQEAAKRKRDAPDEDAVRHDKAGKLLAAKHGKTPPDAKTRRSSPQSTARRRQTQSSRRSSTQSTTRRRQTQSSRRSSS